MNQGNKYIFDDLKRMMYGFGDSEFPKEESVELVEKLALGFLDRFLGKAMQRSYQRRIYNKVLKEDLLYLIKDNKKYSHRIVEILIKSQNVKNLKQQLEDKI